MICKFYDETALRLHFNLSPFLLFEHNIDNNLNI
jgi:hypothetical protein